MHDAQRYLPGLSGWWVQTGQADCPRRRLQDWGRLAQR
jgi:hypothetical protein